MLFVGRSARLKIQKFVERITCYSNPVKFLCPSEVSVLLWRVPTFQGHGGSCESISHKVINSNTVTSDPDNISFSFCQYLLITPIVLKP